MRKFEDDDMPPLHITKSVDNRKDREYQNAQTGRRIWVDANNDELVIHIYKGDEAILEKIRKRFDVDTREDIISSELETSLGTEYKLTIPYPSGHRGQRDGEARHSPEWMKHDMLYRKSQTAMLHKVETVILDPLNGYHCTHKGGHDVASQGGAAR